MLHYSLTSFTIHRNTVIKNKPCLPEPFGIYCMVESHASVADARSVSYEQEKMYIT